MAAVERERQPRERGVRCSSCPKSTFNLDAVCDDCAAPRHRCYVCNAPVPCGDVDESTQLDEDDYMRVTDYHGLVHCEGPDEQFDHEGNVIVCSACITQALQPHR